MMAEVQTSACSVPAALCWAPVLHDFRTPLAAIGSQAHLLRRMCPDVPATCDLPAGLVDGTGSPDKLRLGSSRIEDATRAERLIDKVFDLAADPDGVLQKLAKEEVEG